MVVGRGLVAGLFPEFKTKEQFVIFASGVSNSKSIDPSAFEREKKLVEFHLQNTNGVFVYFSTCSIYDATLSNSPYVAHKLNMERLIQEAPNTHIIFRASNLVGKTKNRNTVLNFFFDSIQNGSAFKLWNKAERNLIGVDDLKKMVCYYLLDTSQRNSIINLAHPENILASDIVKEIEWFTGKKAIYDEIEKGDAISIAVSHLTELPVYAETKLNLSPKFYLRHLLKLYFS